MKKTNRKNSISLEKIMFICAVVLVTIMAVAFAMPIYWMVTGSFKMSAATIKIPPEIFPAEPTLRNYLVLFTLNYPVIRWMLNSFIISGLTVILSIFVSCTMGYSFSKKRYPGRDILFFIILATMMLPKQVSLIPLYLTMKNIGLIDNLLGAVLPLVAWPFGVFMMRQFMGTIPNTIIDSANIDGASEPMLFSKIIIPLVKPAIACLSIIMFMNAWSDFMWQLIILKKIPMWSMNVGISVIVKNTVGGATFTDYGLAMAGATFGSIPLIVIFLSFQKYFVKGIIMGAIKE